MKLYIGLSWLVFALVAGCVSLKKYKRDVGNAFLYGAYDARGECAKDLNKQLEIMFEDGPPKGVLK